MTDFGKVEYWMDAADYDIISFQRTLTKLYLEKIEGERGIVKKAFLVVLFFVMLS